MRYKIFDANTGEPLAEALDIGAAVEVCRFYRREHDITAAIKDNYSGNVL